MQTELFRGNQSGSSADFFVLEYMPIIVIEEEAKNVHFFETHELFGVSLNEGFEISDLLNQLGYEGKELWFHERFHEVGKSEGVGYLELFGQIAKITINIFVGVADKQETDLNLLEDLASCQQG